MSRLYQLFIILFLCSINLSAEDYYVDKDNGLDTNSGSASSPLKTLGTALDAAESSTTASTIYLIGDGPYVVTANDSVFIRGYDYYRKINHNISIVGDTFTQLTWDISSDKYWGSCIESVNSAVVNLSNLTFIIDNLFLTSGVMLNLDGGTISNCIFPNYDDLADSYGAYSYFFSAQNGTYLYVKDCFFEGVTSCSSDMRYFVSSNNNNVIINPFYFTSDFSTAYHIYGGANSSSINFGVPAANDNVWIAENATIPVSNYNNLILDGGTFYTPDGSDGYATFNSVELASTSTIKGNVRTPSIDFTSGTLILESGTNFNITDPFILSNTITVANGAVLEIANNFTVSTTDLTLAAGGAISVAGNTNVNSNSALSGDFTTNNLISTSALTLSNTASLNVLNDFTIANSTFTLGSGCEAIIAGTTNVNSNSNLSGTFLTGYLSIGAGSTLALSSTSGSTITNDFSLLSGRTIENAGTLNFSNDFTIVSESNFDDDGGITNVTGKTTLETNLSQTIAGKLTSADLDINDNVRLTVDNTNGVEVINTVYVKDDAFVDAPSNFGNSTTQIDLTFSTNKYRYFTPPFDITAAQMGSVETVLTDNGGDNSVWLFEYDENSEALYPEQNAWQLIESDNHVLTSGRGYCIWSNKAHVSLSGSCSYPCLDDVICPQIEVTDGDYQHNGYNYIGNSYPLPLVLPEDDDVIAYYYCYDQEHYYAMSGDGAIVTGYPSMTGGIVVPSYGAFFIQGKSDKCVDFPTTQLDNSSTAIRIKSGKVNKDPSYLRVILENETSYDDMVIRFEEQGSFQYDDFDVKKIYSNNVSSASLISVSSISNEGNYTIQTLPSIEALPSGNDVVLPLQINSMSSGHYQLKLQFNEIESDELSVLVYDNVAQSFLPFEDNALSLHLPYYQVLKNRYSLVISKSGIVTDIKSETSADVDVLKVQDGFRLLMNDNSSVEYALFDIQGKLIKSGTCEDNSSVSTASFAHGLYVLKVNKSDGLSFTKTLILE